MLSDWLPWSPLLESPSSGASSQGLSHGASSKPRQGRKAALVLIAGLGFVLAGVAVFDIWADLALKERPLWFTFLENLFPLLIAIGLPYAAWRLRLQLQPGHLWSTAKLTFAGWAGAMILAGVVLGIQVLQGELKPLIIVLQVASGGAVAGFLIGLMLAELKGTWIEVEREKLFESLKQSVLEGIIIVGEEGTVTDWNQGAKEIFGYNREEMVGRPIKSLLPERHRTSLLEGLARVNLAQEDPTQGETFELQGRTKSGEEFPMEISLSSWETGGERYHAAIIRDITDRRRMQREILQVQEKERRRLGQDLHDSVASNLTGANLKLNLLSKKAKEENIEGDIEEAQALIKESAGDVRRLSRGLNPKGLREGNLPSALEGLAENTKTAHFECSADLSSLSDETATHLYRIAQEAVRNAQKYAEAEKIEIRLRRKEDGLLLEVEDDGKGFDPEETSEGLGLRSMRHRAELMGTELKVESGLGEGTLVRCRLPI